jgi:hypothetical protein
VNSDWIVIFSIQLVVLPVQMLLFLGARAEAARVRLLYQRAIVRLVSNMERRQ